MTLVARTFGVLATVSVAVLAVPVSAQALIVRHTVQRSFDLSGTTCGEVSSVTLRAPPHAFAVDLTDEIQLLDDQTEQVVAIFDSSSSAPARSGKPAGVKLNFVGSDDLCDNPDTYPDGWTASNEVGLGYSLRERVRFREYYGHGTSLARERPKYIHGGSDFGWRDLRWQHWGSRAAKGRGSYYYVDKAIGRYRIIKFPMTFRLSKIRRCDGGLRYLKMQTTRTTQGPHAPYPIPKHNTINLTCNKGIYSVQ